MIELPPDFWHGIELFNAQEFYDCHEVLEAVWREQVEPERTLTQGIIQIAVGLYHAGRDNFVGAEKLLVRGLSRLEQSVSLQISVDVKGMSTNAEIALRSVRSHARPAPFAIRRK
jgi:predicted metal-dependent hydrolase